MYEVIRKTTIIVACLMLSKMLHMNVTVYIVLFGVVAATTSYSRHVWTIIKRFFPSIFAALGAVLLNQMFASHPFIIWTCTICYFDHVRRHVDSSLKIRIATLPLFMIIFINTYATSSHYILLIPAISRDLVVSLLVVGIVTSFINHLMPIRAKLVMPPITIMPVIGIDRLKMLLLVGGGLAFIMINQVTTAVFCLVPLITSAMQPSYDMMKAHSRNKMLSQIGGCSIALVISMLFAGSEVNVVTYGCASTVLVFTILLWCNHFNIEERAIHSDALMGCLIPYQLYIGQFGNNFGINSIMLRGFELVVTLLIIYTISYWLSFKVTKNQINA